VKSQLCSWHCHKIIHKMSSWKEIKNLIIFFKILENSKPLGCYCHAQPFRSTLFKIIVFKLQWVLICTKMRNTTIDGEDFKIGPPKAPNQMLFEDNSISSKVMQFVKVTFGPLIWSHSWIKSCNHSCRVETPSRIEVLGFQKTTLTLPIKHIWH
jgi:hypothetical protein